jgi:hypothetical protein
MELCRQCHESQLSQLPGHGASLGLPPCLPVVLVCVTVVFCVRARQWSSVCCATKQEGGNADSGKTILQPTAWQRPRHTERHSTAQHGTARYSTSAGPMNSAFLNFHVRLYKVWLLLPDSAKNPMDQIGPGWAPGGKTATKPRLARLYRTQTESLCVVPHSTPLMSKPNQKHCDLLIK